MKLFSDLLRAHIPVYLSQFVSLFSPSVSLLKQNWMSRMRLLKPPKVHISVLHYYHIRWTQLDCVCKVACSSLCSGPFIYSALLSLSWNSLWKRSLEFIRWSKFWVDSHMFGYLHMRSHMFGSQADLSQPYLTRKTTITQSLPHSIYKLKC